MTYCLGRSGECGPTNRLKKHWHCHICNVPRAHKRALVSHLKDKHNLSNVSLYDEQVCAIHVFSFPRKFQLISLFYKLISNPTFSKLIFQSNHQIPSVKDFALARVQVEEKPMIDPLFGENTAEMSGDITVEKPIVQIKDESLINSSEETERQNLSDINMFDINQEVKTETYVSNI